MRVWNYLLNTTLICGTNPHLYAILIRKEKVVANEVILEVNRKELLVKLIERDGATCQYPGCDLLFSTELNSRHSITIDHKFPQAKARAMGWSFDEIWSLDNLQLMGRACNSKKSDREYDDEGNLPGIDRIKAIKSLRPDQCTTCGTGRMLLYGEICDTCGSGPQPACAPKYLQRTPKECDHDDFYCWMCYIGHIERKSALSRIIGGP